jgi:hypothetical protein
MSWFGNLIFRLVPTPHILRVDWRHDSHDTANALFTAGFRALSNYVEVEKALVYVTTHPEVKDRPKWFNGAWWRSAEHGLMRLREEEGFLIDGKPGVTSATATELLYLYDWWTRRRKTLSEVRRDFSRTTKKAAEELIAAEDALQKEDDVMFLRLAAIRKHLVS